MPQPYKVFTIYAREDAAYLEELRGQMRPLEIAGRIRVWSDREINPGVDWEMEIVQHLDTADIILILVSAAYYNSVYIHEKEIKYAFARHNKGEAKVLPIIVRHCSFGDDPGISSLQVLPTDGKPVTDSHLWPERDKAWLDVVAGLKRTLDVLAAAERRVRQDAIDAEARLQAAEADKQAQEERARVEATRRNKEEQTRQEQEAAAARAREVLAAKQAEYQRADRAAWQQASEAHQVEGYQTYLSQFPQGEMAREARARIKDLKKQQTPPLSLGRYAAFGGGGLVLLFLIWQGIMFYYEKQAEVDKREPLIRDHIKLTQAIQTSSDSLKMVQESTIFLTLSKPDDYPMERVHGGTFQMGSPATEKYREYDECQHAITVSTFYMGRYEVTQAQWKAVMGKNPSKFKNCDECPVENVSWNDIQDFIKKLNQKTGKTYRLPSEAEWEYAARGGNKSNGYNLYAGGNALGNLAWCAENAGSKTHPVGKKTPNELGLYDMSGNVWEWCQDEYNAYPNCKVSIGERWFHVFRGGGWNNDARMCRSATRINDEPAARGYYLGFRLVSDSSQ